MNATQTKKEGKMISFRAIEDNGGGLALLVWDGDELIYVHNGYEYTGDNQLLVDMLNLLHEENDMADWDGNELDEIKARLEENGGPMGECLSADEVSEMLAGDPLETLGYTEESSRSGGWTIIAEGDQGKSLTLSPRGRASWIAFGKK